jgi:hypothetical protein
VILKVPRTTNCAKPIGVPGWLPPPRAFAVPASFANVGGKIKGSIVWQCTLGSDDPEPVRNISSLPETGTMVLNVLVTGSWEVVAQLADGSKVI